LTIPDFRGNRYFNTLGNLVAEPRASLLFVDFETGDLLQLQGSAQVDWKAAAVEQIAGAERLWRFHVARGWRRKAASPLRWVFVEYARTTLQTGTATQGSLPTVTGSRTDTSSESAFASRTKSLSSLYT